ncbi:hypothetical protein [Actinoplanes sp. NPDC026670]|uniref:hypothetical protein n=1 Tax=Actinoplanes sp. NPDC026670 TaxID=3154700 RepID=UPI0033E4E5FC
MSWTELLPETGDEPAGLAVTGDAELESAVRVVESAARSWKRLGPPGRDLPAEARRAAAVRLHLSAVRNTGAPDEGPVHVLPGLLDDDVPWSRSDLAWALRTADDYLNYDGASFVLPGCIAVSLSPAELEGFGPALVRVLDEFINERDTPRHIRRQLAELYGVAAGRVYRCLPLDLLPWSCGFGAFARDKFGADLSSRPAGDVLRHAATLTGATPSKTWLRAATTFPERWAVEAVLECFTGWSGHVWFGTDEQLRGLVWMLSLDRSEAATDLLARVAVAASAAEERRRGYPFAPLTAAAAVEAVAVRPGDLPAETLARLSRTVHNRALLSRMAKARRLRTIR